MSGHHCPSCASTHRDIRDFVVDLGAAVGRCHHDWHIEVVSFEEAVVGDDAYTWETPGGFGEYRFETAGDPRQLYGEESTVVRKRWRLVEIVEFEGPDSFSEMFCPHGRGLNAPCGDCTIDKYGHNDPWPQPEGQES